jgi:HEAT repeat protein
MFILPVYFRRSVLDKTNAIRKLAETKDPLDEIVLMYLADDQSWLVRFAAISALSQIGGPFARIVARALITDAHPEVRSMATETLAVWGNKLDWPHLIRASNDRAWIVRHSVLNIHSKGKKTKLPILLRLMADKHPVVRRDAALALAELNEASIIPQIEHALSQEKNHGAHLAMLFALYRLGQKHRLIEVFRHIRDASPDARTDVVIAVDLDAVATTDFPIVQSMLNTLIETEIDPDLIADAQMFREEINKRVMRD